MNKTYKLSYFLPVVLIALIFVFSAFDTKENKITVQPAVDQNHTNKAAELVNARKNGQNFEKINLFKRNTNSSRPVSNAVSKSSVLNINKDMLSRINSSKPENLVLDVPYVNGTEVSLELVRVNIVPENFTIKTSSGSSTPYNGGVFYQGIIKGDETSIAAISIFDNDVIGIVATSEGTYNLGAITDENKKNTEDYIFYRDSDLMKQSSFRCDVPDQYGAMYRPGNNEVVPSGMRSATVSPVRMFYVCDNQFYIDRGSNQQNVANYVFAIFNQVKILYANETLGIALSSSMFIYTSTDPYATFSTSQTEEILTAFGTATKNEFDGDLAQLLSTRTPVTGAIAWVNVLCQSYEPSSHSGRYAFCEIENDYQNVPVYSWTVEVMAHETGHNFGSQHTQACVWPTISGQIDSCVQSEGGCVVGTRPNSHGTIMSYCHIPAGGAIDFTRGFGPLPGDTIRLRYSQALCIDSNMFSSEQPLIFTLLQNYPNPFNPSTNIKFALPQAGLVTLKVYDVTGREVATLINNSFYAIGIFSYTMDASLYNLASGVYMYKLDVNQDNRRVYSEIKKMVLVK